MVTITTALPNTVTEIEKRAQTGRIPLARVLGMLASRLILFAVFQVLIALTFRLGGNPQPWEASIAWWPLSATLTNLVGAGLLDRLTRLEGIRLVDLYRPGPHSMWREVLILLGLFVIGGPLGVLPNLWLGQLLFKDTAILSTLFFRPLPLWAAYPALVIFPITNALVELPTYYGYIMPRLAALTQKSWVAILLAALFHSLQHLTLPLIFDWRFMLWRGLMFLPFALFTGIVIHWRPRLLPYMLVFHALMDAQLIVTILAVSGK